MAITMSEKYRGRSATIGISPRTSFEYVIRADSGEDENDVLDYVATNTPATIGVLSRQYISVRELRNDAWEGSVDYGPFELEQPSDPETGDVDVSFNVTTESVQVLVSKETISATALPGYTATDHKGVMNVNPETGEGAPVPVLYPRFSFSETHYLLPSVVDAAFKGKVFELTGTVNDDDFKGFAAGEVLFKGMTGSMRGDTDWALTFEFECQPNRDDIVIGDFASPFSKKGWEYLWVMYGKLDDSDTGTMKALPSVVYVERLYDLKDFSELGIGT
ncbi:MAG: hypothetical protein KDA16_00055 [Phycisphaerales bacterium]|nr:hypothetical protein [Phycisphaerales bacterium]